MYKKLFKELKDADKNKNNIIITIIIKEIEISEYTIMIDNICSGKSVLYIHSKDGWHGIPIKEKIQKLYEDEEEIEYQIELGNKNYIKMKILK